MDKENFKDALRDYCIQQGFSLDVNKADNLIYTAVCVDERGLVKVDDCHLKGNRGGILLSVVSLDGNNEIFPIVVDVVDSENKKSRSWLFHHLKTILTATSRDDWTIMSNRQKGVDPSLDNVWPKVPRRYCARHLCKNFEGLYRATNAQLFWVVTNAYSA
ncbi:hypothetical protein RDABS01_025210 [Bienertia sinuspersici]